MRRNFKLVIALIVVSIVSIVVYLIPKHETKNNPRPLFESQMVSALNLHFVNSETLYDSPFLRVFNDTIVGYHINENPDSCFYFVQGLKKTKHKSYIYVKELIDPCASCTPCTTCVTEIEMYKNGGLYFPRFGGSIMLRLGSDGSLTSFFKKYENILFYANKILFYGSKAVIISFNGVFIFDIQSEKLLWKYNYHLNNGLSTIIENKLVFTFRDERDRNDVKTIIQCIDLNNFKTLWTRKFKDDIISNANSTGGPANSIGGPSHEIAHNVNHQIVISTTDSLLVLNLNNGVNEFKFHWPIKGAISFATDSNRLYFANGKALLCYNINGGNKIWQLNLNHSFIIDGIYKSNIIAQTDDRKNYVIIDKLIGKLKTKIANPFLKEIPIIFIENYILFHRKDLYK
jgi:hypothetical protein